jgi:hypothetical protein
VASIVFTLCMALPGSAWECVAAVAGGNPPPLLPDDHPVKHCSTPANARAATLLLSPDEVKARDYDGTPQLRLPAGASCPPREVHALPACMGGGRVQARDYH